MTSTGQRESAENGLEIRMPTAYGASVAEVNEARIV
jgi:hypothetical protein